MAQPWPRKAAFGPDSHAQGPRALSAEALGRMLLALGAVAQLAERIVRNDEVRGSNPLRSTCPTAGPLYEARFLFGYQRGVHGFEHNHLSLSVAIPTSPSRIEAIQSRVTTCDSVHPPRWRWW